jgi:hypothetical protein
VQYAAVAASTAVSCVPMAMPAASLASRATPPQPVITEAPPPSEHPLPFGRLVVTPTTVVAGSPAQAVTAIVKLDRSPPAEELIARLYRPRRQSSARVGFGLKAQTIGTRRISLGDAGPGTELSFRFARLDPPPGRYRLDLLAGARGGSRRLVSRAAVVVYGQSRLPVGRSASGPLGLPRRLGPLSLAGDEVDNDVSNKGGNQEESYVAVRPNDPSRVIAAVNPADPDTDDPQAWISDDFMAPGTGIERTLPSTHARDDATGSGTITTKLCCDPALAADTLGNLWYAVIATEGDFASNPQYVVINRVAAGTTTFQPTNVAIPRRTTKIQDKVMITIDNWAASPKRGMLYAVWTEFPGENIVVSQCNTRPGGVSQPANCDVPGHWSAPVSVTDSAGNYSYGSVAAAPSGEVYVVWWDYGQDNRIGIDRCQATADCAGGGWETDKTLSNLGTVDTDGDHVQEPIPFICPVTPAPGGRVGPQPYVKAAPNGRFYVAFSGFRVNGTSGCTNSATDQTWDSFIALSDTDPNTFPGILTAIRLSDDDPSDTTHHFFPSLAIDPSTGNIESSFYSTRADANRQKTNVYMVRSTDEGLTYGAMTQISTATSDFSSTHSTVSDYGDYEGADAAGGQFFPVWADNRAAHGGDTELYILSPGRALRIDDVTAGEGDAGSTSATFDVRRLGLDTGTVTVHFATADASATAPRDYQATSGNLTFGPGETTKQVAVPVVGDRLDEPDRSFLVNLSSPGGARISNAQGVATIVDNDVAGGGSLGPPGPLIDLTAPRLRLGGSRSQRLRRRSVSVIAACNEPCTLRAAGTVSVPGPSRTFRLKRVKRHLAAGVRARLRLRLSRRSEAAVKRALARRRKVRARVTVTAQDASGNKRLARRTIRLRR